MAGFVPSLTPTRRLVYTLDLDGKRIAEADSYDDLKQARDQLDPEDRTASVLGHRWVVVGYPRTEYRKDKQL